jgi:hypothetical protein
MVDDKYIRSAAADRFQSFESDDAMVVWLDLLGTKDLSHKGIVERVDLVMGAAGKKSSVGRLYEDGTIVGTPQWTFQYSLVGDALVMVQKDGAEVNNAHRLSLLRGAAEISSILFSHGVPHRAAVFIGSVKCSINDRAAIITGRAIVDAYILESNLKTLGIFLDISCLPFIEWLTKHSKADLEVHDLEKAKPLTKRKCGGSVPKWMLLGLKSQKESLRQYIHDHPGTLKVPETLELWRRLGLAA